MDQRFVTLPFTQSGNMRPGARARARTDTPPGYYLMFVLDASGVPSMAQHAAHQHRRDTVHCRRLHARPSAALAARRSSSRARRRDSSSACTAVTRLTSTRSVRRCVKVDQLGRWIGDPVNGPVTGTSTTGTAFTKTCPRDYAVSGFRGRSAQYVNQIDIQCRALTPNGGLTGDVQYLGATAAPAGRRRAPLACGTGNPVYALYGRSGSWLDNFGVQCRAAAITPISINSVAGHREPGFADRASSASRCRFADQRLGRRRRQPHLQRRRICRPGWPSMRTRADQRHANDRRQLQRVRHRLRRQRVRHGNFHLAIVVAPPLVVTPMPSQPARLAGTQSPTPPRRSGGVNVVYKWDFGDGTPETAYSASNSVSHTFAEPGVYFVTLTVNDDSRRSEHPDFRAGRAPAARRRRCRRVRPNIAYETRWRQRSRLGRQPGQRLRHGRSTPLPNAQLAEITVGTGAAQRRDRAGRARLGDEQASRRRSASSIPVTLAVVQTVALAVRLGSPTVSCSRRSRTRRLSCWKRSASC